MSCDAMDTTVPSVHVLRALIEQQYMPVIQRNAAGKVVVVRGEPENPVRLPVMLVKIASWTTWIA